MLRWLAWLFFSFGGRIPRSTYWLAQALLFVPGIISYFAIYGFGFPELGTPLPLASIVVDLLLLIPAFAVVRKRLNDRGHGIWASIVWLTLGAAFLIAVYFGLFLDPLHPKPGERALLAVLFVISLWFGIDLGVLRGEQGPNRYGPDPLAPNEQLAGRSSSGRTLGDRIRNAVTALVAVVAVLVLTGHGQLGKALDWALVPAQERRESQVWRDHWANKPALKAEEEGDAARKAGDASGATDNYSRAIALYGSQTPAAAWTYHMRAFALEDLGRNDEALSDRNKALSLNPNFPGGYRWRGDLLAKLGRYDEALMDFNKALSGVPDSSITMTARAETLEKMGRSDEALVDYTKAIAAAHDRSKWIKRLEDTQKWLMKLIGKTQGLVPSLPTPDKIEELSRSLSDYQNQTIAYAYGQRGNFLRNANRFDEALSDYDHALEFAPDNRFIYVNRGWLYEKKGDIEKAHADYEKAASLAPPDEWLTQALERTG